MYFLFNFKCLRLNSLAKCLIVVYSYLRWIYLQPHNFIAPQEPPVSSSLIENTLDSPSTTSHHSEPCLHWLAAPTTTASDDFLTFVPDLSTPTIPRCSGHATRPPTWTKDYSCPTLDSSSTHYLVSSCVNFNRLSPEHMCWITCISEDREPSSYHEEAKDPHWQQAMEAELCALMENQIWDIIPPLPHHCKPIGCKWVYKINIRQMVPLSITRLD